MNIEELESFNRVSQLVEEILDKFNLSSIKSIVIGELWKNMDLCLEIDKKVKEIWQK